jgi:hypothetical protein
VFLEQTHHWRSKGYPPVTARALRGARSLKGLSLRPAVAAFEISNRVKGKNHAIFLFHYLLQNSLSLKWLKLA